MMEAIQAQRPVTTTLCNYDLAGRPFRHTIDVTPIADARGSVTLFRATSRDVVWLGEDASVGRHPVAVACRRRCDGRQTIDMCLASYELHSKADDGYGFDDEAIKCPRKVPRPLSLPQPSAPTLVVLTQASPPFAVVWASEDWLKLCGFTAPEVVGHNLSLIQGPGTDRTAVARIMAAARAQSMVENVQLVNYTKTKQPFSHVLSMRPVYENGELAPPTLFRATSTDARSLGYPTGGCLPLESDTSEVTEELEFWGEEVEDFTAGWQDVAVGLEILDLEERTRVAKARRRAEECDAAIVSPRAPCH